MQWSWLRFFHFQFHFLQNLQLFGLHQSFAYFHFHLVVCCHKRIRYMIGAFFLVISMLFGRRFITSMYFLTSFKCFYSLKSERIPIHLHLQKSSKYPSRFTVLRLGYLDSFSDLLFSSPFYRCLGTLLRLRLVSLSPSFSTFFQLFHKVQTMVYIFVFFIIQSVVCLLWKSGRHCIFLFVN